LKKKENLKKETLISSIKAKNKGCAAWKGACKNNPLRLAKVKTKKKLKKRESRREKKFPGPLFSLLLRGRRGRREVK
jgi:hypothetical protein